MRPFAVLALILLGLLPARAADRPPNIVYVMSDELAYFELGHMGNPYLKTPHIDQFAMEGIRFTSALAGSPVCAPLRCTLMTGKHAGHASVRANDGGTPLRADEETVASMLKALGYATGGFGKWGCGGRDSTGVPEAHGFDLFFGYYDQVHAHSFYPPYLIENSEEVALEGNIGGRSGQTYSHYEIMNKGLAWIREHRDEPFFAYFPITPPHGMYDIPADDPAWDLYRDEAWMKDDSIPQDVKNYAAMVTMVDRNLGEILSLLRELGLEENTIVFFTGDNGGHDRFANKEHPRGFFGPNVNPRDGVGFRGGKGNLYEGGLRIPYLVRWPGKIEPGRVSDLIFYHPDVLPTLAELTGATVPADIDGISILPTLLGEQGQTEREMLYWEFGGQTAVRMGRWKSLQPKAGASWQLYDLEQDISETTNVALEHPDIVEKMKEFAAAEHRPVEAGRYIDPTRTRHERDRWAKYGTSRAASAAPPSTVHRIADEDLIPAAGLRLLSFSSENRGNDRKAVYAIDGKPETLWHTRFGEDLATHPHELIIDLGGSHEIRGFRYLARQGQGWNGAFAETEFYVSVSADRFPESPTITATFGKVREAQAANLETPIVGRYVKVKILSEVDGGPWASAAELGVVGEPAE